MDESRAGMSSQAGEDALVSLALCWLVSLLPGSIPSRTGPGRDSGWSCSPAGTERHQGTLSHETSPSEMRQPPEGVKDQG